MDNKDGLDSLFLSLNSTEKSVDNIKKADIYLNIIGEIYINIFKTPKTIKHITLEQLAIISLRVYRNINNIEYVDLDESELTIKELIETLFLSFFVNNNQKLFLDTPTEVLLKRYKNFSKFIDMIELKKEVTLEIIKTKNIEQENNFLFNKEMMKDISQVKSDLPLHSSLIYDISVGNIIKNDGECMTILDYAKSTKMEIPQIEDIYNSTKELILTKLKRIRKNG